MLYIFLSLFRGIRNNEASLTLLLTGKLRATSAAMTILYEHTHIHTQAAFIKKTNQ